jgi:hypothetical protein
VIPIFIFFGKISEIYTRKKKGKKNAKFSHFLKNQKKCHKKEKKKGQDHGRYIERMCMPKEWGFNDYSTSRMKIYST